MTDEQPEEVKTLFKNIQKALTTYGSLKSLNTALYTLTANHDGQEDVVKTIVNAVCEEFKINQTTLLRQYSRGKIREAKQVCCCILHFELGFTIRTISKRVFKTEHFTFVFAGISKHRSLNMNEQPDREYKERYDRVLNAVKSKIK